MMGSLYAWCCTMPDMTILFSFFQEHPELACEDTANYLVVWCINLEMEEKHDLMSHVAHQTICMQFILELAKQLERDPRSCVSAFFHR